MSRCHAQPQYMTWHDWSVISKSTKAIFMPALGLNVLVLRLLLKTQHVRVVNAREEAISIVICDASLGLQCNSWCPIWAISFFCLLAAPVTARVKLRSLHCTCICVCTKEVFGLSSFLSLLFLPFIWFEHFRLLRNGCPRMPIRRPRRRRRFPSDVGRLYSQPRFA